ncbi:hypothetical protein [Oceanobacillus sp. 1P07AA]|uniref:hypothetical protein n=1 Tax=Oceanobacillus sp. 1P07AA TaxID=3132293 RepID=UPI0039A4CBE2
MDNVVLITGSATGLGRATALKLASEPATAEEVAEAMIFAMNNGKLLNGSTINCAGGQIYT